MTRSNANDLIRRTIALAVCGLLVAGCAPHLAPSVVLTTGPATGTPDDPWVRLQQQMPYPFTAPLAPAELTAIDGTYIKVIVKDTPTVHCVRCPEYAPEGGLWKIQFKQGVFRVMHLDSGWPGLGSYSVSGNQLLVFNDPTCTDVAGRYTWSVAAGSLRLVEVDDACAIHLRALNFTMLPWVSCQPPNREAAVSGHWLEPSGC